MGLHRLNRTEYAREIQRLLDIDVDVNTLAAQGCVQRRLRQCRGDAARVAGLPGPVHHDGPRRSVARPSVARRPSPARHDYRINTAIDQDQHIDGLPLGTRGGTSVVHDFPADGEYVFNIRDFLFMGAGYVTKVDDRQQRDPDHR